jgi:putative phosphoesterase
MIIGILSDAHGNYLGLEKCLNFLKENTEKIFFLGDAVGYFPFPNEIIDRLRSDNVQCVLGNHDAMLLGILPYDQSKEGIYKIEETKRYISEINLSFLEKTPLISEQVIDGKKILFIHGSPHDYLNGYVYPDSDISIFSKLDYDVFFMGHTHRSFIRKSYNKLFVNVGSCGFSRDNGNKITIALYNTTSGEASIKNFIIDKGSIINTFSSAIHPSVIEVLNRNNIYE